MFPEETDLARNIRFIDGNNDLFLPPPSLLPSLRLSLRYYICKLFESTGFDRISSLFQINSARARLGFSASNKIPQIRRGACERPDPDEGKHERQSRRISRRTSRTTGGNIQRRNLAERREISRTIDDLTTKAAIDPRSKVRCRTSAFPETRRYVAKGRR